MTRPIFDPRITLGNILTLASMAIGAIVVYGSVAGEWRAIQMRLTTLEKRIDARDLDHDRIVSMEADVKIIRSLIEKRQN